MVDGVAEGYEWIASQVANNSVSQVVDRLCLVAVTSLYHFSKILEK